VTETVRASRIDLPAPRYDHVRALTDAGGLYEHADRIYPRRECGYCVDDVARALVVVCRDATDEVDDLREQYLAFVLAAQEPDGRFHNRRRFDLGWTDTASVEDCWGRALWGLGTALARVPHLRERALAGFDRAVGLRSPHPRAMAFAALGAAEVLAAVPGHVGARALITAAADVIGRPALGSRWPWPEPRLSYANAVLPEVLLVAGRALDSPGLVADGLGLLEWLLDRQIRDGHLSVVPTAGWGPVIRGRAAPTPRAARSPRVPCVGSSLDSPLPRSGGPRDPCRAAAARGARRGDWQPTWQPRQRR